MAEKSNPQFRGLKKFEPYFVYQGSTADEKGKTLTITAYHEMHHSWLHK